jgi:hypothetical protein
MRPMRRPGPPPALARRPAPGVSAPFARRPVGRGRGPALRRRGGHAAVARSVSRRPAGQQPAPPATGGGRGRRRGFLLPSRAARGARRRPAPLRLQLQAAGRQLRVQVLKRRGPPARQAILLDIPRPARHFPGMAHVVAGTALPAAGSDGNDAASRLRRRGATLFLADPRLLGRPLHPARQSWRRRPAPRDRRQPAPVRRPAGVAGAGARRSRRAWGSMRNWRWRPRRWPPCGWRGPATMRSAPTWRPRARRWPRVPAGRAATVAAAGAARRRLRPAPHRRPAGAAARRPRRPPRQALPARPGARAGRGARSASVFRLSRALRTGLELPAPVEAAPVLLFAARRLVAALAGWLAAYAMARCAQSSGGSTTATVRPPRCRWPSALPVHQASRIERVLKERLDALSSVGARAGPAPWRERNRAARGSAAMSCSRAPGKGHEALAELHGSPGRAPRAAGRAGLACHADHRPELASVAAARRGQVLPLALPPRPLWLDSIPPKPCVKCVAVRNEPDGGPLTLVAGPERIESGWWDGADARRDYFVAIDGGRWLWIFRDSRARPAGGSCTAFLPRACSQSCDGGAGIKSGCDARRGDAAMFIPRQEPQRRSAPDLPRPCGLRPDAASAALSDLARDYPCRRPPPCIHPRLASTPSAE